MVSDVDGRSSVHCPLRLVERLKGLTSGACWNEPMVTRPKALNRRRNLRKFRFQDRSNFRDFQSAMPPRHVGAIKTSRSAMLERRAA